MADNAFTAAWARQYLAESGRQLAPGSMELPPLSPALVGMTVDNAALVAQPGEEADATKPPHWPYASKLEMRYALYLDHLQHEHQVHRWEYEPFKLRLGDKCFYTPDFLVIWEPQPKELYLMEVKGYWRDDARVKIKVAAKQHSYFHFVAVEWIKGRWKEEQF